MSMCSSSLFSIAKELSLYVSYKTLLYHGSLSLSESCRSDNIKQLRMSLENSIISLAWNNGINKSKIVWLQNVAVSNVL